MPPPPRDIHHIDVVEDDNTHMLSQDDGLLKLIVLDYIYEVDGVTLGPQVSIPFSFILNEAPF